jgi:hypothetical protein
MAESLQKLTPDRDLVCYFQHPSAIAALSSSSASGYTVSGTWRQQFDWSVIEWNRDNTFEHPLLRNLPDGDLSELTLTYDEVRTNCIPIDSNLYPTVDWPYLRVWLDSPEGDVFRRVRIASYATPSQGSYSPASATFTLTGTLTPGDVIELAWDPFGSFHYNYQIVDGDTLTSAAFRLATIINQFSATSSASATASGAQITLTILNPTAGATSNNTGVYGTVSGAQSETWQPQSQLFSGGVSPSVWTITLPFGALTDADTGVVFAANPVRKMRWTYAADLQPASFDRSEFQVVVSNWSVSGSNRAYSVAGPGSRRIEDDSTTLVYQGIWTPSSNPGNRGNFSGGSIAFTTATGSGLTSVYQEPATHELFLGTRRATSCGSVQVVVDGGPVQTINCNLSDDVLVRVGLGTFDAGTHTVVITNTGANGTFFYFDFLEIAYPSQTLPDIPSSPPMTLATDWDTDHSIALPPERTAWLISKLGFNGRANHYQGALWFFEMMRAGQIYATGTVTFSGQSEISVQTSLTVSSTVMVHLSLLGDTPATIALAFALQINNGSTAIWASASANVLTITARAMGTAGNSIPFSVSVMQANLSQFNAQASGSYLQGGVNGTATNVNYLDSSTNIGWRTDLTASPRINRAARDWATAFFIALASYGITPTAAFSTELQFVDPTLPAGMAQRYYNNGPVVLNTPAIQTNFSPTSLAYWQEVHLEMAQIMTAAGVAPYLQFGEVQWWYFPDSEPSLPFYDAYTQAQFQSAYGRPIALISSNTEQPSAFPDESSFLPTLIGEFTASIMNYVRQTIPQAKFEVLYPPDVNSYPMNAAVNLPTAYWTPEVLACMKTENFTYTGDRDLDQASQSVDLPASLGFGAAQRSHLVGISDYTTPWANEVGLALGQNVESVVLFALDQFCLIGYPTDFYKNIQRGISMA